MSSLILCTYLPGDIDQVRTTEADPWAGWAQSIEQSAGGIRSIMLGAQVVACIGFVAVTPGVADSFAVIDRLLAVGHGAELARLTRVQTLQWMVETRTHRAAATCSPGDRAAAVFLRAIGYRRECVLEAAGADGGDLLQFKFIRGRENEQGS